MTELPRYLSPQELASLFNVPVATVYRWRHSGGGPPGARIGRHLRYRLDAVIAWAETQEGQVRLPSERSGL